MPLNNLFKLFDFAGDPGAPEKFFDSEELRKQQKWRDKYLGDVKSDRDRYRGLRDSYTGRETTAMGEAGRLWGLGERAIDSSGRFIANAGRSSQIARDMATGRDYQDTIDNIGLKSFELDRLQGELGGIRRAMGQRLNVGNSKYSAVLRGAMTSFYNAEKSQLNNELVNSNLTPAAQMALKERLARGAAESVTQAEIQGMLSEEDADMRRFLNEAQLVGSEFNMARAGIDTLIAQQDVRRAQQSDILSSMQGDLNVAGQQMNQGIQYSNLGQNQFNMGQYQGDTARFYEGAQQQMTGELLGDARDRITQQQQLKMSDAANEQAYNEYKAQGAQRGFNNIVKAASTAARVYMAAQTGGMSEVANAGVQAATSAAQASQTANASTSKQSPGGANVSASAGPNRLGTPLNYKNLSPKQASAQRNLGRTTAYGMHRSPSMRANSPYLDSYIKSSRYRLPYGGTGGMDDADYSFTRPRLLWPSNRPTRTGFEPIY